VEQAYRAIAEARGPRGPDAEAVVLAAYAADIGDEFIAPTVIADYPGMAEGDGVLCFNFRADRVREILAALLEPGFDAFPRARPPRFAAALALTHYSDDLDRLMDVLFEPQRLERMLGDVVAAAGAAQLRAAETEKYPHVTYFMNGGREAPFAGEDRILVPSPKVATYDLQPEMSAAPLTDGVVEAIGGGHYDLVVMNFANPDMVGHTGSLPAAVRAVETVDACLGRIATAVRAAGGAMLVIADHGNCELMRDPETGAPHTAHTTNPVPVLLMSDPPARLRDGRLADVAPTLLGLMGLPQPPEMTGRSLTT
jgi:2,3-bisphosphoglycerate-independent phosphoglycerate mutase